MQIEIVCVRRVIGSCWKQTKTAPGTPTELKKKNAPNEIRPHHRIIKSTNNLYARQPRKRIRIGRTHSNNKQTNQQTKTKKNCPQNKHKTNAKRMLNFKKIRLKTFFRNSCPLKVGKQFGISN